MMLGFFRLVLCAFVIVNVDGNEDMPENMMMEAKNEPTEADKQKFKQTEQDTTDFISSLNVKEGLVDFKFNLDLKDYKIKYKVFNRENNCQGSKPFKFDVTLPVPDLMNPFLMAELKPMIKSRRKIFSGNNNIGRRTRLDNTITQGRRDTMSVVVPRNLTIISHGYMGQPGIPGIFPENMGIALCQLEETSNIIVVDWSEMTRGKDWQFNLWDLDPSGFLTASHLVPYVAKHIASFLGNLYKHGSATPGTTSCMGHSLGSYICVDAAVELQENLPIPYYVDYLLLWDPPSAKLASHKPIYEIRKSLKSYIEVCGIPPPSRKLEGWGTRIFFLGVNPFQSQPGCEGLDRFILALGKIGFEKIGSWCSHSAVYNLYRRLLQSGGLSAKTCSDPDMITWFDMWESAHCEFTTNVKMGHKNRFNRNEGVYLVEYEDTDGTPRSIYNNIFNFPVQ